jgi:predicted transcriptional regulator
MRPPGFEPGQRAREELLRALIKKPMTANQIMKSLGISKSTCYYLLKELEEKGLIKKTGYKPAIYSITLLGRNFIENQGKKKARVHNIKVVCYLHEVNLHKVVELGKKAELNNWEAYYISIAEICQKHSIKQIDATLQVNLAENVTAVLHLPEFYASSINEAYLNVHNLFNKIRRILQLEGIILDEDWIDVSMIYGEYAFETDEPVEPGTVVYLNRKAEDMKGDKTEQTARIWVDESKGKEIETNDSNYADKRLMMPEYVYETLKKVCRVDRKIDEMKSALLTNLEGYNQAFNNLMELHSALAENIAKHIKMTDNVASVAGEMKEGMKEMRLTLSELGKHYRLLLIGQILFYGLIILLIVKEVIT